MMFNFTVVQSFRSRAPQTINSIRTRCAIAVANRQIKRIFRLAALSAADGLTHERLQEVVAEADRICATTARRFGVPEEVIRSRAEDLRLLRALAGVKSATRTFVVPIIVAMRSR